MAPASSNVIPIPLGLRLGSISLPAFVYAYLVGSGNGWAVVDTGPPDCAPLLLRAIEQQGIREKIRLILLTHGHFDHFGSALELQRQLPGQVPIALHPADGPFVRGERWPRALRPSGLSAAVSLVVGAGSMLLLTGLRQLPPWRNEQLNRVAWLSEVGPSTPTLDLAGRFGFKATLYASPGHSPGSVSLHLPTGELFCGDVISAGLRRTLPRWPMLFEDRAAVRESWRRIAGLEPTCIYPGHGGPFPGETFLRLVQKLPAAQV